MQVYGLWCYVIFICRFVRENNKFLEEEVKVMVNVLGWKVGENVYNFGRWMFLFFGKLGMDLQWELNRFLSCVLVYFCLKYLVVFFKDFFGFIRVVYLRNFVCILLVGKIIQR